MQTSGALNLALDRQPRRFHREYGVDLAPAAHSLAQQVTLSATQKPLSVRDPCATALRISLRAGFRTLVGVSIKMTGC